MSGRSRILFIPIDYFVYNIFTPFQDCLEKVDYYVKTDRI